MDAPQLSVIIPAYNESHRLLETLQRCGARLQQCVPSWEIVVVDDGSEDDTREIARSVVERDDRVRLITIEHGGKGAAVRRGMLVARGRWCFLADADLSMDLNQLPRFFGAEVLPRLAVSNAALEFALDRMATAVDRPAKSAALVRRGLRVETLSERPGRRLERESAAEVVVRALGALDRRSGPTVLPVAAEAPRVTASQLAPAARRARVALSAPVYLRSGQRSWRVPRWRIAELVSVHQTVYEVEAIREEGELAHLTCGSEHLSRPRRYVARILRESAA